MDVAVGIVLEPAPASDGGRLGITRRFLVTKRRAATVYGGWWEFPGGKIERGETPARAIVRELYEEVGVDARVRAELACHTHVYDHATVRLHPLVCELEAGSAAPRAVEVAEWRWTDLAGLDRAWFLPANGPVLDALGAWLAGG